MYDAKNIHFLLHVSDFHLTEKDKGYVKAQNALKVVAQKLRDENIKVDYLIHTGDVINSGDIHEAVAKSTRYYKKYLSEDGKHFDFERFSKYAEAGQKMAFNNAVKAHMKGRFKKAKSIMRVFINDLNLPAGNVVICCGNHDVMRTAFLGKGVPACKKEDDGTPKYVYECSQETQETMNQLSKEDADNKQAEEISIAKDEAEFAFQTFNNFLDDMEAANSRKRNECWDKMYPVVHCVLGELNLLILNTNWRNPQTVKNAYFCVHCDQIRKAIESLEQENGGRAHMLNVILAHKPIYEICETARLSYKRYIKTSFMATIQDFIGENGIYLCGDKHTRSMVGAIFHDIPHYICGEPFTVRNEETKDYEVEYNLLGIVDGKLGMERKIHLRSEDGISWTCDIRPQDAVVSALYELSKGHISPKSYAMIDFLNTRNSWESLRQRMYQTNDCAITQNPIINAYFKAICKYRVQGEKDYTWKENENIFAYVYERIQEGLNNKESKNIMNLRGGYSSGKSTFLGLLYIYLLYQYSIGAINFIPVYFSLENNKMLEKVKISDSYYNAVKKTFSDFAEKVGKISRREQQPVCYIIDRLDEQDYWSFSSEDSVGRTILDTLAQYDDAWYVMSFGQHRLPHFKATMPVRKYSDKSDVLYFNPIDVRDPADADADIRLKSFVKTYLEIENYPAKYVTSDVRSPDVLTDERVNEICGMIRRFRRLTITPGFMRQNYDYLTAINRKTGELENKNATVKQISSYYIDRQYERCLEHLGYGFVDFAPAMAYLFSDHGFTYERFKDIRYDSSLNEKHLLKSICANEDKIYNTFMFIKKHRDSREYLIALHYHRELRYYAEHPAENIADDSILNAFITRNIAVEIRKMCTDTNKFVIVCEKLIQRKKISNCTLSMLAYCLAHIPMYDPIRDDLREKLYARGDKALAELKSGNNIWEIPKADSNVKLKYFLDLSLKLTMELFSSESNGNTYGLVKKLIDNDRFTVYNRQHQMLYYRDLRIRGEDRLRCLDPGRDMVYKSFDFYHCFNYLIIKLNSKDSYPLREYDLYTLCDLVVSRLEPKEVKVYPEGDSTKSDTFFLRENSKEKVVQIFEQMKSILDDHLNKAGNFAGRVNYADEAREAYNKRYEHYDSKIIVDGYYQSILDKINKELSKRKQPEPSKNDETTGANVSAEEKQPLTV